MLKSVAIALAFVLAGSAPALAASGDAEVEVTIIHATNGEGGVAAELQPLGRYLTKSFAPYTAFKRLGGASNRLAPGVEARLQLPNKSELVYRHQGLKDGFFALHLEVGGLKSTVNVKDGATFFQAGRGYDGGMIVLAFRVASVSGRN